MKLTREQYDEIGNFYVDDFPVDDSNQDFMFELFNYLPLHAKVLAIEWGFNDTVFRDVVFEFLIKNQLGMTVDEYYNSDIFDNYHNYHTLIEIDFGKLKK